MNLSELLPDFSRSQRRGILFLLLLIGIFQAVIYNFDRLFPPQKIASSIAPELQHQYDSLRVVALERNKKKIYPFNPNYLTDYKGYYLGMSVAEIDRVLTFRKQGKYINSKQQFKEVSGISDLLFQQLKAYINIPNYKKYKEFSTNASTKLSTTDINRATASDLQSVNGVGKVLSARIVKYRNAIGGFTDKTQLNKVYGLEQDVVQRIWKKFILNPSTKPKSIHYNIIGINTASEKDLQKIYGIGEKLAARIVKYRNSLGGFTIKEQLNDVYGLTPEIIDRVWQQFDIKKPSKIVEKISLNEANIKELAKNRYISYKLAKKIVSYRTLHGAFRSFSDLLKINDFPKHKLKQISLFLKL